jgi:hypothetical protein
MKGGGKAGKTEGKKNGRKKGKEARKARTKDAQHLDFPRVGEKIGRHKGAIRMAPYSEARPVTNVQAGVAHLFHGSGGRLHKLGNVGVVRGFNVAVVADDGHGGAVNHCVPDVQQLAGIFQYKNIQSAETFQ